MLILIRGAGDIASGIGWRLVRSGFPVAMTDLEQPTAVRWKAAFCQAVWAGSCEVEGVAAHRCDTGEQARRALAAGVIPVLPDPEGRAVAELRPEVVVDAILAKRNLGTQIADAPLVIGVGPGFTAGADCHCVIETMRGHTLGRCLYEGSALPNTGIPGNVGGYTVERVLRTPCAGTFEPLRAIGDRVEAGETVALVEGQRVVSAISGCLRGILPAGTRVPRAGFKAGDVDARCVRENCFTISDKALAIAGGVLEAVCHWRWEHGD